jgi:hypothetical protein
MPEGATDIGGGKGGREGGEGQGERWHYLQQEPAFPPAHATDPQGLMQRVGGAHGDGLEKDEDCDEEEAAAEWTKKHHRQTRGCDGLIYRRTVVGASSVCCLASLAPVRVYMRARN